MHYFFRVTLFIIVALFPILISFTGCSTHQPLTQAAIPDTMVGKSYYITRDIDTFTHGEKVHVLSVQGQYASTKKGKILLSDLEKERSTFQLTIHSLASAKIRILNIKPVYHDGIWLKTGKYHIETSKPGYKTDRRWIAVYRDKEISISLKRVIVPLNGTITWQRSEESHTFNGQIFQMQREEEAEKMTWPEAKAYCSELNVTLFGFAADRFSLPDDTQLLMFSQATRPYTFANALYWTATTDDKHLDYAKYVNINSGENSWYKKRGKTYVMCQHETGIDLTQSLETIAHSLREHTLREHTISALPIAISDTNSPDNQKGLNALEMALFLKYGDPLLQNVRYDAVHHELSYELISRNHDSDGTPYFYKEIRLRLDTIDSDAEHLKAQLGDPSFEPIVDFNVVNGKLIYIGM